MSLRASITEKHDMVIHLKWQGTQRNVKYNFELAKTQISKSEFVGTLPVSEVSSGSFNTCVTQDNEEYIEVSIIQAPAKQLQ